MKTMTSELNSLWARLMVAELLRNGIDTFVVCPGSRSSALALAIAGEPRARCTVHVDERGAAFFALGCVSAAGKPAVLLCTSGTAVANFLPAVVECSKKKLPLIVLTADRPPELRQTGAHQTIEQPGIFGSHVRFACDMPCPTEEIPPAMVLTTVDQAVYRARYPLPGPVHINCMFREPLTPSLTGDVLAMTLPGLDRWQKGTAPYTQYCPSSAGPGEAGIRQAATVLGGSRHGIIIVGKLSTDQERRAVLALARKLQWPVAADTVSGLRLSLFTGPVVHYFDQMLLSPGFADSLKVDAVLQIGGRMTSKRVEQWIAAKRPRHYVMVLNHPLRNDPAHQVTLRLQTGAEAFCMAVTPFIKVRPPAASLRRLLALSRKVGELVEKLAAGGLSEPATARVISKYIPAGHGLFLGNSMPIRDMDMYGAPVARDIMIGANRGASGIDGNIASALGFARGAGRPVTLLLGDLAALHDLNSLLLLRSVPEPLTLVVINNDGGGIFSFLPVAQAKEHFERFFGTPHGGHFDAAARMFGAAYVRPGTLAQFNKAYSTAVAGRRHTIIEVVTDRQENITLHQAWQQKIRAFLDDRA